MTGTPPVAAARRLGRGTATALAAAVLLGAAVLGYRAGGDFGGAASGGGEEQVAAPGTLRPRPGTGPALPAFELSRFGGEGTLGGADLLGTPVVLNFWASWCPFCIEEMPGFERVHRSLAGAVAFVGVDLQDDRRLAADLIRRTGVTYPVVEDPDGSLFVAVEGVGMPTTLLVTADGRVAHRITGPVRADTLERLIHQHLVEAAP